MRPPHALEGSKKTLRPKRMIFFDSEARTNITITPEEIQRAISGEKVRKEHDAYLVCANFCTKKKRQKDKYRSYYLGDFLEQFWTDVDNFARTNERTYIFAHNAKYDVLVTGGVHYLTNLGYTVQGFSDDNPFIMRLSKVLTHNAEGEEYAKPVRKSIIILSSTNYFAQSLKSLGEIFHLPKLDFEHGREIDMNVEEDREESIIYCKRDVEILTTAILSFLEFVERENLGAFSMTVAGQAFSAFRHRFMLPESIYIHSHPAACEVERRAYAGGRNECFRMGKVDDIVHVYDINSMYPYVMRDKLYPTKLVTYWRDCTPEKLLEMLMNGYLAVCDAKVHTQVPMYHLKKDRLTFPIGTFWTSLTTPELLEAIERGHLLQVKNVAFYEAGDIFGDYVRFFYESRLQAKAEGDKVHDHLFKIFLNSLYGKFGQKNENWEKVDEAPPDVVGMYTEYNHQSHKNELIKVWGGGVFARNTNPDDIESFNSFPAVAAHVTGYARMLIWSIIEAAGRENVYYTDTDSVFVNAKGGSNLEKKGWVDSKRLGALKLEKTGLLWLNGCKDYMMLHMVDSLKVKHRAGINRGLSHPAKLKRHKQLYYKEMKIKGVPKSAVMLAPDDDGHLRFAVNQWGGFADRFRERDFTKFYNKVIVKTLKREYTKALVDGVKVIPFELDHDAEEREEARKAIEYARQEAAAAMQMDIIQEMCKRYGYIQPVRAGERYYGEYNALPRSAKVKYFRRTGRPIDVWANDNGFTVQSLLDTMRG